MGRESPAWPRSTCPEVPDDSTVKKSTTKRNTLSLFLTNAGSGIAHAVRLAPVTVWSLLSRFSVATLKTGTIEPWGLQGSEMGQARRVTWAQLKQVRHTARISEMGFLRSPTAARRKDWKAFARQDVNWEAGRENSASHASSSSVAGPSGGATYPAASRTRGPLPRGARTGGARAYDRAEHGDTLPWKGDNE